MGSAMLLNITLVTTRYFQIGGSPHWERFSSESSNGTTLWDSTEIWVAPRAPGMPSAPVVVIGSFCHPNATDGHHYSTVNVASSDRQILYAKMVRDETPDEYSTRTSRTRTSVRTSRATREEKINDLEEEEQKAARDKIKVCT